ncbi:MAG TPA: DUF434 domain-containing protein [Exilispira sp.]|nr:DUF434 domain-containing protein [Exilispira sp.]
MKNLEEDKISTDFFNAITDYLYLIEKGYTSKSVIKLIGDRYKLDGIKRTILQRGIDKKKIIYARNNKKIDIAEINNRNVFIDGYNLLFTISNYFQGLFIFIGMDGFIRDCANIGGRNKGKLYYADFCKIVYEFSKSSLPSGINILLDAPVSKSVEDKSLIEQFFLSNMQNLTNLKIDLIKSPDRYLSNLDHNDVVITSDSAILNKTPAYIFDLFRWYIEKTDKNIFSLEYLLR